MHTNSQFIPQIQAIYVVKFTERWAAVDVVLPPAGWYQEGRDGDGPVGRVATLLAVGHRDRPDEEARGLFKKVKEAKLY